MIYPSTSLLRRASVTFAVGAALAFGSVASAATILIDFGSGSGSGNGTATTSPDSLDRQWNNFSAQAGIAVNGGNSGTGSYVGKGDPAGLSNLLFSNNTASGISISVSAATSGTGVIERFNGVNVNGATTLTGDALARAYPATSTGDSLFGNGAAFGSGWYSTTASVLPVITFTGLDPNTLYSFTYFGSRTGIANPATDPRIAHYNLTNGTDTSSVSLNASNNTGNTVSSSFLAPSPSGTLTLTITPDASSTGSKFVYLNVLEITTQAAAIPEPGACAALAGLALFGFAGLRRRTRA